MIVHLVPVAFIETEQLVNAVAQTRRTKITAMSSSGGITWTKSIEIKDKRVVVAKPAKQEREEDQFNDPCPWAFKDFNLTLSTINLAS